MKKELSTPAMVGIGAGAVLILGGVLWFFLGRAGLDPGPSPDLLEKQIAYQKSLTPGGGQPGGTNPGLAAQQSEMEARARTGSQAPN